MIVLTMGTHKQGGKLVLGQIQTYLLVHCIHGCFFPAQGKVVTAGCMAHN